MTVVNIDVSDVASEFHEDDAVLFYAPAVRPAAGGGVVNTRPVRVPLDRGKASRNLEPGPVMVRLQCRGIADTGEKQGIVPDEGPVTLADVLGDIYDYTPAVVSVVTRAKLDAESARNDAVEAAERVGTAEQVREWAEQASTAAASAQQVATTLPTTIQSELDTRVPPLVADAIADDQTVADAAVSALGDAVDGLDLMERTTAEGLIAESLPWRGIIPDGTDINTIRTAGIYTVPTTQSARTMINWPTNRAGILTVWTNEGSSATVQEATAYVSVSSPTEKYTRASLSTSDTGWSPWATSEWTKGVANGTAGARTNIDTFRTAGAWAISSTAYVDGLPTTAVGVLEVFSWPSSSVTLQRYTARNSDGTLEVHQRGTLTTAGFAGVAWRTMGGGQAWVQGVLPDGTDLATLRTAGAWLITGIVSAKTILDMPIDTAGARVEGPGLVEVVAASGTARAFQRVTVEQNGTLREFTRTTGLTSGWGAWQESSGGGGTASPTDPTDVPAQADVQVSDHASRVEYARSRRGGGIGTGGKAVIMLRFDHWLVAFRDRTLPILEKYQLPATLNMNADNLGREQNGAGSITWEQVQDWNQYKGIEIANHGSTHRDQTTTEGIYHEIVNGRRNLEKNMPLVAVEAWQEHGASYFVNSDIPGDIGLDLGRTINNFTESYAGRLVMAEHAVIEGKSGGFFHPLSGTPQIGQSHYSFDRSTAAEMIQQAEYAATFGAGLTMYAHPGSMDNAEVEGKYWPYEFAADGSVTLTNPATGEVWNFADEQGLRDHIAALDASGTKAHLKASHRDFDTFCAHLAQMRDEGRIMIMTATGGGFADQHSDKRRNLLVTPTFGAGHESWWSYRTGWTINGGGTENVLLTSSPTASPLGQGMLMYSRFGWAMGAAHELLVRVSANVETTLTLQVHKLGDPTLWNAERQFTIPGDGVERDYRLNFTLPRQHMGNTLSQMTVRIGGPSMTIHGAPLLAAI